MYGEFDDSSVCVGPRWNSTQRRSDRRDISLPSLRLAWKLFNPEPTATASNAVCDAVAVGSRLNDASNAEAVEPPAHADGGFSEILRAADRHLSEGKPEDPIPRRGSACSTSQPASSKLAMDVALRSCEH
jgi:hypothetical protein